MPSRRRTPGLRTGVSLLETTIVLAIIATLAAVAAPRYGNSLARYRVDAAAQRVVVDLTAARRHARMSSAPCGVTFDHLQNRYTVSGMADLRGGSGPYEVDLSAEPYLSEIKTVTLDGGGQIVTFDGYGEPRDGGSIVIRVGAMTRTVILNSETGKAAVQ